MRLRPLNDAIILETPESLIPVDSNSNVVRIASEGTIALPEYNTLMKVSNEGNVISCGPKCHYPFKVGQKVFIEDVNKSSPDFRVVKGVRYRVVREHEILCVCEND